MFQFRMQDMELFQSSKELITIRRKEWNVTYDPDDEATYTTIAENIEAVIDKNLVPPTINETAQGIIQSEYIGYLGEQRRDIEQFDILETTNYGRLYVDVFDSPTGTIDTILGLTSQAK